MPTLAIAILRNVEMGDELVRYINRIDETLLPFGVVSWSMAKPPNFLREIGIAT